MHHRTQKMKAAEDDRMLRNHIVRWEVIHLVLLRQELAFRCLTQTYIPTPIIDNMMAT